MHVLEIDPGVETITLGQQDLHEIFAEVTRLNVSVYTTLCYFPHGTFEKAGVQFSTTSKDLHLGLGKLGEDGRLRLCHVLEGEFAKGGIVGKELLFRIRLAHDPEGKYRAAMLVTRTVDTDDIIYHCSPAH